MTKLQTALIAVQSELKAPKNQRNNFGKYNYRSAEDILEAVKPLLSANGLSMTISDSVQELSGMVVITSTATITDGTDSVSSSAQAGVDPNRKGMDIAQSFGSSSSYSRKYAMNGLMRPHLLHVLLLPLVLLLLLVVLKTRIGSLRV